MRCSTWGSESIYAISAPHVCVYWEAHIIVLSNIGWFEHTVFGHRLPSHSCPLLQVTLMLLCTGSIGLYRQRLISSAIKRPDQGWEATSTCPYTEGSHYWFVKKWNVRTHSDIGFSPRNAQSSRATCYVQAAAGVYRRQLISCAHMNPIRAWEAASATHNQYTCPCSIWLLCTVLATGYKLRY